MECVGKLQHLLSSKLNDECINDILQGAVKYKDDLPCYSALKGELLIWKNMWKSNPDKKCLVSRLKLTSFLNRSQTFKFYCGCCGLFL